MSIKTLIESMIPLFKSPKERAYTSVQPLYSLIPFILIISAAIFIYISNTLSISVYNDPFDYFRKLSYYYWIGLALTLSSIIILLNTHAKEAYKIMSILLLACYTVVLPVLIAENPRFHDIYLHGAEAFPIIEMGHVTNIYPTEYPLSFIFMAETLIISDVPEPIFFKYFEIIILSSIIIITYYTAKVFIDRFALIAPLAFVGGNWVDKGYFSPQAIALLLYVIFFLSFYTYHRSEKKSWLFIAIFTSSLIVVTNPTNSIIIALNLIFIIIILYIFRYKRQDITNIGILALIVFIAWSAYNADSKIFKLEELSEEIVTDLGSMDIKVTPSASMEYESVNNLRLGVSITTLLISSIFVGLALKDRRIELLLLAGVLLSAMIMMMVMAFGAPFLFGRSYLYLSIATAIIIPILYSRLKDNNLMKALKVLLFLALIIFIIILPITRYGRDSTTYITNSIYAISSLISEKSVDYTLIADDSTLFVNKYTSMRIYGKHTASDTHAITRIVENSIRDNNKESAISEIIEFSNKPNAIFIASNYGKNQFDIKFSEGKTYDYIEESYGYNTNIVMSSGNVRVFSNIR